MTKIGIILLFCMAWLSVYCQAGSIDRFAAKFVLDSAIRLIKNYPLITGTILAIIFRHQLVDLFFGPNHKNLFSLFGEHPFISFAGGIGLLLIVTGPIAL